MTEASHSRNSASKFEAEMLCPGRRAMTEGAPRSTSKYAAEGTAAHQVLEWGLRNGRPAEAYLGRLIEADGFKFNVGEEMAAAVQTALDNIAEIASGAHVMAESRVYYNRALNTPREESWGTADVIVLRGNELQVLDYKHGMGVKVDADDNVQMKLYALGALQMLDELTGDEGIDVVRLVILQPRARKAPSEWCVPVASLKGWAQDARRAREQADAAVQMKKSLKPKEWQAIYLNPGEKQCRFCEAKTTCPALTAAVLDAVKASPKVSRADVSEFE